jgi:hypothetical protein
MKRWVYFALLAMIGVCAGIINGNGWPGVGWDLTLTAVVLALLAIAIRYIAAETQEHEYRRTYAASKEAAYSALCGVLGSRDYKIAMSDPDAGTLLFNGGRLGPWIPRLGVECRASVRQIDDRESEIVIAGHAVPTDKDGHTRLPYPEGMGTRVAKLLDAVSTTVVTYAVIDAALAARDDIPAQRQGTSSGLRSPSDSP